MLRQLLNDQLGIIGEVLYHVVLFLASLLDEERFTRYLSYEQPKFIGYSDGPHGFSTADNRTLLEILTYPQMQTKQLGKQIVHELPFDLIQACFWKSFEKIYLMLGLIPIQAYLSLALVLVLVVGALVLERIDSLRAIWNQIFSLERAIYSWFLSKFIKLQKQPNCGARHLRLAFNKTGKCKPAVPKDHSHPQSAAVRNASAMSMDWFCTRVGREAYYIQKSASDEKYNRSGCRTYFWMRDVEIAYNSFWPEEKHIMCLTDVDYYMDMPSMLVNNICPYLISTVVPSAVAKSTGEYTFTIDEKDNITYVVSGGAVYKHQLWNYGSDVLVVKSRQWFGLINQHVCYNVEKRELDEHHQLLLLVPSRSVRLPWFVPAPDGCPLERVKFNDNGFLRMKYVTPEGVRMITGVPNGSISANVSAAEDSLVASTARVTNVGLNIASVKTALGTVKQDVASILCEYHRLKGVSKPVTLYCGLDQSIRRYQFEPRNYDPDARPSLRPFMQPLVPGGCYAPDRTASNDRQAIQGRVIDVKNGKLEITPFLMHAMTAFAKKLVPVPHSLHPVDIDELYENQSRPEQRNILNQASISVSSTADKPLQTMQKSESYPKVNDSRIITTFPGVTKFHYSRYIYAITKLVNETKWYAFGKKPIHISAIVARMCELAKSIDGTDLSRMDGRVCNIMRELDRMIMLLAFAYTYHNEVNELMDKQVDQLSYTRHGEMFETGDIQGSGSSDTAVFNSCRNAFMAFCTKLRTVNAMTGQLHTVDEAWDSLGLYGGDDGLTADVDPNMYAATCAELGQVLTVDHYNRGDVGVMFLSREYSQDVWNGCPDSMCDVKRQIVKFHATHSVDQSITPMQKLTQKCASFNLTDPNTPIISDLVEAVYAVVGNLVLSDEKRYYKIASYFSKYPSEDQFPNENVGGWMDARIETLMPTFDLPAFRLWLEGVAEGKNDVLKAPLFDVIPPIASINVPSVVDGDVHVPAGSPDPFATTSAKPVTIVPVCNPVIANPVISTLPPSIRPIAQPNASTSAGGCFVAKDKLKKKPKKAVKTKAAKKIVTPPPPPPVVTVTMEYPMQHPEDFSEDDEPCASRGPRPPPEPESPTYDPYLATSNKDEVEEWVPAVQNNQDSLAETIRVMSENPFPAAQ